MLPDRSVVIGQKLVEKAKIQKFKCDILSNFQTMCKSPCNRKVLEILTQPPHDFRIKEHNGSGLSDYYDCSSELQTDAPKIMLCTVLSKRKHEVIIIPTFSKFSSFFNANQVSGCLKK